MRIVIDSTVLIDALAKREPWSKDVEDIFLMVANHIIEAYISPSSIADIYYLTEKCTHDEKVTRDVLNKILSLFHVLTISKTDYIEALASPIEDYEDAIVEYAARKIGVGYIVTHKEDGLEPGIIPAVSPRLFIEIVEDNE